jgi:hypothetical protein
MELDDSRRRIFIDKISPTVGLEAKHGADANIAVSGSRSRSGIKAAGHYSSQRDKNQLTDHITGKSQRLV